MDFDNELGVFEFVYLCFYDFIALCFVVSSMLDNWSSSWVQLEIMADHRELDFGHILC